MTIPVNLHGQEMNSLEFWVVNCAGMTEYPILLATDFLKENDITVNLAFNRLSGKLLSGATWDCYVSNGEVCKSIFKKLPCYAASAVSIPAETTMELKVAWTFPLPSDHECGGDQDLFFIDEEDSHGYRQLYGGFVDAHEQVATVLVTNHGVTVDVVRPGEILGYIYSVVEVLPETSGEVKVVTAVDMDEEEEDSLGTQLELGDHLSEEQKDLVKAMLKAEGEFLSLTDADIGCLKGPSHRIELIDETPIYQRPRRFPESVTQEIEEQCKELQLADIIEPSSSPWSSPVVPIRKKDGSMRLCIDYRKLNSVTKADKFPLPNLTDAVFGLHGIAYFTSLDLVRGFYQQPLEERSREFTAFSTPRAHWQFKRLCFGLKNAPSAFQRQMQGVLSDFPWRKVIVYIDDVLIMSETFEEHLSLVQKVLRTLGSHGVKVKSKKCHWFERRVEFLGHGVSSEGLKKLDSYVENVTNFPRPDTVRKLREFLGLVNFQRKFIPNCSVIMKPLSRLTGGRPSGKLKWSDEMERAFAELKVRMKDNLTLAFPDYSPGAGPLRLFTDASGSGVGACLSQVQEEMLRPIAYASMTFSDTEATYNTLERELAAIRWGVRTFRAFLYGVDFVVHTDHQPLVYLQNMQIVNSRLARTLQDLSDYTFIIHYTPGKANTAADALSRLTPVLDVKVEAGVDGIALPEGLFLMKEVPGGGDSLMTSLHIVGANLQGEKVLARTALELRQELVDELLKHPEQFRLKSNKHLKRELKVMRFPGQLPCMEVLLAFSQLYKCSVMVHYGVDIPVVYTAISVREMDGPRVHLQCLAGVHFNPVIETGSYVSPCQSESLPIANPAEDVIEDCQDEENHVDVTLVTNRCTPSCERHEATSEATVMVTCEGRSCCALLDTGAQVNCISSAICSELELEPQDDGNYVIKGVGSTESPVRGAVEARVWLSPEVEVRQKFAVVNQEVVPFCLILGVDFLASAQIELDFKKGTIKTGEVVVQLGSTHPENSSYVYICEWSPAEKFSFSNDENMESHAGQTLLGLTPLFEKTEITKSQRRDRRLSTLLKCVYSGARGKWPKHLVKFKRYLPQLSVQEGTLIYKRDGSSAYVVPFALLVEIMLSFHYSRAHPGRQKLLEVTKEHVWHPSLSVVAADITRSCVSCQRVKIASQVSPPIHKITASEPFELVAADIMLLPVTSSRNMCCLVVVDHCSKWLAAVALKSKKASAVVEAMRRSVLPSMLKAPLKLLTDNGAEFTAGEFRDLLDEYGIRKVLTTPYKPSSNGLVERSNRTLTELLRNLSAQSGNWEGDLAKAVTVYNSTYHSEICMSPSQFLLTKNHDSINRPLVPCHETAYWKEGNPSFAPFHKGQKVLKKVTFKGKLVADKFAARFEGPYTVVSLTSKVTYLLKCEESGVETRAHHTQLRRFYDPPRYLLQHPAYERITGAAFPEAGSTSTDAIPLRDCEPYDCSLEESFINSSCEEGAIAFRDAEGVSVAEACGTEFDGDFLSEMDPKLSLLSRNRLQILQCERELRDKERCFRVMELEDAGICAGLSMQGLASDSSWGASYRPSNVLFASDEEIALPTSSWPISPIVPLTYDTSFGEGSPGEFTPLFCTNSDYNAIVSVGLDAVGGGIGAVQSLLESATFSGFMDETPEKFDYSLEALVKSAERLVELQQPFVYPESDISASAESVSESLKALRSSVAEMRKSTRLKGRGRARRSSDSSPIFPYHTRSKGPVDGV